MLLDPVSTVSGTRPDMREAVNWYFRLEEYKEQLAAWLLDFREQPVARPFAAKIVEEFLEPPVIYMKREEAKRLESLGDVLPAYRMRAGDRGSSVLEFDTLEAREKACADLSARGIRYRTGKTLVPFRLTGNISWGVPAPALEGLSGLTVWVWPESLWAPISFTMAYLEQTGADKARWTDWWCSEDAAVVQFIGVDNVYFYGPAEMAMFLGYNAGVPLAEAPGGLRLPSLVVNNHLLFMSIKASSSGDVKPPTALELLDHYTAEQLRAHFLSLGLGLRSVSFRPGAYDPDAGENGADPVLKEGNLLTNVFNRFARTCFYTAQRYFGGRLPEGGVDREVLEEMAAAVLDYEKLMYRCEFHSVMALLDTVLRRMNKYASKVMREADESDDGDLRRRALVNMFHMLRTGTALLHPIAPEGTALLLEYLNLDREFWSWETIFEPLAYFIDDPSSHRLRQLEPRTDFFKKHPSQLGTAYKEAVR